MYKMVCTTVYSMTPSLYKCSREEKTKAVKALWSSIQYYLSTVYRTGTVKFPFWQETRKNNQEQKLKERQQKRKNGRQAKKNKTVLPSNPQQKISQDGRQAVVPSSPQQKIEQDGRQAVQKTVVPSNLRKGRKKERQQTRQEGRQTRRKAQRRSLLQNR